MQLHQFCLFGQVQIHHSIYISSMNWNNGVSSRARYTYRRLNDIKYGALAHWSNWGPMWADAFWWTCIDNWDAHSLVGMDIRMDIRMRYAARWIMLLSPATIHVLSLSCLWDAGGESRELGRVAPYGVCVNYIFFVFFVSPWHIAVGGGLLACYIPPPVELHSTCEHNPIRLTGVYFIVFVFFPHGYVIFANSGSCSMAQGLIWHVVDCLYEWASCSVVADLKFEPCKSAHSCFLCVRPSTGQDIVFHVVAGVA